MSRTVEFRVVGLTFVEGYPANLHEVADRLQTTKVDGASWADLDASMRVGLPVALIRNPDNEYDGNAVEVHVPVLGRRRGMVGHVPADLAAKLAPSLDRGDTWDARLEEVLVNPDHTDRPGALVVMERVAVAAVAS